MRDSQPIKPTPLFRSTPTLPDSAERSVGSTTISCLLRSIVGIVGIVGVDWVRPRHRHASDKSGDGGNFIPPVLLGLSELRGFKRFPSFLGVKSPAITAKPGLVKRWARVISKLPRRQSAGIRLNPPKRPNSPLGALTLRGHRATFVLLRERVSSVLNRGSSPPTSYLW
jgi:hypothetical protein